MKMSFFGVKYSYTVKLKTQVACVRLLHSRSGGLHPRSDRTCTASRSF